MKAIVFNRSNFHIKIFYSLYALLFSITATSQFQIVGMQYNGQNSSSVNLTILSPKEQPFTGSVSYDPNKIYNSGTTFKTPAATSIAILCQGQTQVMKPNSALKLTFVKNGIKAETLTGNVQHVLKDVKSKLSFYKAGNGYTWAHAEGTIFEVEAYDKSKKAKFSTQEGTIAIIEDIPVSINEKAKNRIDRSGKAEERQLSTSRKTLNSAGEEYISNNVQPIEYATYEEALAAFDDETYGRNESVNLDNPNWTLIEELAGDFTLLGGLYLENGQPEAAIDPLRIASEYYEQTDPEGILTLESYLYLAEALIQSEDEDNSNEGKTYATTIIETLNELLEEDIVEFDYAEANGDEDLAWEIADELVDICEYLGWSHDLLGETEAADLYYDLVDKYSLE